MIISLLILNIFIDINVTGLVKIIVVCLIYAFVGGTIYIFTSYKMGLIESVFGSEFVLKIRNKFKKAS